MFKLFAGLGEYLKWQDIKTDNVIFRLHNIFTTVLLLTCSLIITATQFVGNPIQCIVHGLPSHVINTYCWISSTFTMPDAFRRQIGSEVAHPGVANDYGEENDHKYYTYYQWVCFALFFQGMMCYAPKYLWDIFEGNLLRTLVMGMNNGCVPEEDKNSRKKVLIDYMIRHVGMHTLYVLRYFVCEFLCLVNIIVQLYLMNLFFGGEFFSYGIEVMSYSGKPQEERLDPMVYIFPRVTKCTFHKYGPTGTIQKHDSLCVLPLNIVNEKTYIFIWFWFMFMAFMLLFLFVYRTILIVCPRLRPALLHTRNRGIPREICSSLTRKIGLGDWWVLYMLGNNIDPLIYREIICELAKKIETSPNNRH